MALLSEAEVVLAIESLAHVLRIIWRSLTLVSSKVEGIFTGCATTVATWLRFPSNSNITYLISFSVCWISVRTFGNSRERVEEVQVPPSFCVANELTLNSEAQSVNSQVGFPSETTGHISFYYCFDGWHSSKTSGLSLGNRK